MNSSSRAVDEFEPAYGWTVGLAVAWCSVVTIAYYLTNHAYYTEKITVFGQFLLAVSN